MMTCDDWKAFSHDYVFGDLADPARELLDRHAAACASCLGEARALKLVDRRLRLEPVLAAPSGLARRALMTPRPSRELWRVAAAVLVAGGLGAISVSSAFAHQLPDDVRRAPRVITEAARLIPSLLLPTQE